MPEACVRNGGCAHRASSLERDRGALKSGAPRSLEGRGEGEGEGVRNVNSSVSVSVSASASASVPVSVSVRMPVWAGSAARF